LALGFALSVLCIVAGCKGEKPTPAETPAAEAPAVEVPAPAPAEAEAPVDRPTGAPAIPGSLPYGLLLAFSQFGVVDGKATSQPGPARFDTSPTTSRASFGATSG
jgi:hypothetical protein